MPAHTEAMESVDSAAIENTFISFGCMDACTQTRSLYKACVCSPHGGDSFAGVPSHCTCQEKATTCAKEVRRLDACRCVSFSASPQMENKWIKSNSFTRAGQGRARARARTCIREKVGMSKGSAKAQSN